MTAATTFGDRLPTMTSIRSRRVVLDGELRPATIHVGDGLIVAIDDRPAEHDLGDLIVLPGLVDSHVHVNEPGRSHWEGFATATTAAIAGGTTTVVDMPLNSIPPTTTVAALTAKREAAAGKLSCDVAFWGGIVPGTEPEVPGLVSAGVCGFKVFLVDSGVSEFPPMTVADVARLDPGVPVLVHAEDEALLGLAGPGYDGYLASRPAEAEAAAIVALHRAFGPVHVLHVSSADGVAAVEAGPVTMTGETCPHYLTFVPGDVTGTEFKCAPPIRGPAHREALWEGLKSGTLSMVVSDHSPAPPEMKRGGFSDAWGGIASLELRLPVVWTGAVARGIGPVDLAAWLSQAPATIAGLDDRKGSIAIGKDADLVVFDPDGVTIVEAASLWQRHPVTPYDGMRLRGTVVSTFLRGEQVFAEGDPVEGRGRMLVRK